MFIYHYRLRDRYNRRVVGLAVLGDPQPGWRPDCYHDELLGCRLEFHFPTVKLLNYANRTEELERSDNPFAILVLAHLKSQETQGDADSRYKWKFRLARGLYQHGWDADQVRSLFRFIDWMLDLPSELEEQFTEEISQFEEENKMSYVTSIERQGIKKGLLEGIKSVLEIRFGAEATAIMAQIHQLSSVDVLEEVLQVAKTVDCPEDLAAIWSTNSDGPRRDETPGEA